MAPIRRPRQSRAPSIIPEIEVGAGIEKRFYDACIAPIRGLNKSHALILSAYGRRQQHSRRVDTAAFSRSHQRRRPTHINMTRIRAPGEQCADNLHMAQRSGVDEACAQLTKGIHVRAVVEKNLNDLCVTSKRGAPQRPPPP